ncbi:L-methionine gamma-lyase [Mytilus edulis]|uniref:L-methionine gamma-lyase n=1 Tax=Mytilus edulis TaxID=6550 RepID=A0A8S3QC18_MYTED|nr:L-methionine gamma-lyase [Mytilus edulis]
MGSKDIFSQEQMIQLKRNLAVKILGSRKWQPPLTTLERGLNGLKVEDVSIDTMATSSRYVFDCGPTTEPLVPPIYHSSTYKLKSVDDYLKILDQGGYIYSRLNNFTCDSVQAAINVIEGGKGTLVFNTGMSAISTALFCFLKSGDHIIICNPVYSGIYDMAVNMFPKFNIEVSFVQAGCSVEEYEKQIKPNTKMLYGETPCNPNMAILDLEEFGKLGKSKNILTMVDSTFAGPYLQPVIKYGIDISMHSCTKYLGGHSDLIAGSLTFSSVELWQTAIRYQTTLGASLINYVLYPGLESHPHHQIAKKQMKAFSGMMSVEVKGGLAGGRILAENLRIVQLAVSLGGVESLIQHPATMTHGPMLMSDEDRLSGGITNGMVRISIGIEDPDDLIADFKQALDKIPESLCAET